MSNKDKAKMSDQNPQKKPEITNNEEVGQDPLKWWFDKLLGGDVPEPYQGSARSLRGEIAQLIREEKERESKK